MAIPTTGRLSIPADARRCRMCSREDDPSEHDLPLWDRLGSIIIDAQRAADEQDDYLHDLKREPNEDDNLPNAPRIAVFGAIVSISAFALAAILFVVDSTAATNRIGLLLTLFGTIVYCDPRVTPWKALDL